MVINIKHTIAFLVFTLFIISGCNKASGGKVYTQRSVKELMDSAEQIMNDNPSQALNLLDSIDSKIIRSRASQARYALLYSETMYKNYIKAPNDSLIMIAVRYYSIGKDIDNLFRSYYCLGCIYSDLNLIADAAVVLSQAEQLSIKIDDDYRIGLLYSQLGNVYSKSYDFQRAKDCYLKAVDHYGIVGKEKHKIYALSDVGGCSMQENDYDAANSIFEKVQKWAELNSDSDLLSSCLLNRLICSLKKQELSKADSILNTYLDVFGYPEKPSALLKLSHYYIAKDKIDTAQMLINRVKNNSISHDPVYMSYLESVIQEKIGNPDSALVIYKYSIELQNKNLQSRLDQPIVGAQKEYYKTLAEAESLKVSHNHIIIYSLFCFIGLLLIIVVQTTHFRKIKTENEKQNYLLTISELKRNESSNNETINLLNSKVNHLFGKQYSLLEDIYYKMMMLDNNIKYKVSDSTDESIKAEKYNKKTVRFYRQMKDIFEDIKSNKNQEELNKIIDTTYNKVMTRLSHKKLGLTNEELLILRLSILGMTVRFISDITGTSQKNIYQKRSRTIERVSRKQPELAIEVVRLLKNN